MDHPTPISDANHENPEESWGSIANELGHPRESIEFLFDALQYAPQYRGEETECAMHSSAEQLCRTLLCYGRDLYGEEYPIVFLEWGLATSESWGRLVYDLIDRGLCQAEPDDRLEDFNHRFDLTAGTNSRGNEPS